MPSTQRTRSESATVLGTRGNSRRRRTHARRIRSRRVRSRRHRRRRSRRPQARLAEQPGQVGHPGGQSGRSPTGSHRRRARRSRSTTTPTTSARKAIKDFEDKYGVKIEVSTFNDGDEAITKLRSGVDFDIYNANYTEMSRLVTGGLVRPLNHSYIPDISQRLADLHQPVVRPGLAVHRAVHHLHHRNRLAQRPSARRHRRTEEPVRIAVGSAVQEQDRDPRRLAHRDGDGVAEAWASPTSTRRRPTI